VFAAVSATPTGLSTRQGRGQANLLYGPGSAGSSAQLADEGVDDHEADEDGKDPKRP
jgi:hypothetical protein